MRKLFIIRNFSDQGKYPMVKIVQSNPLTCRAPPAKSPEEKLRSGSPELRAKPSSKKIKKSPQKGSTLRVQTNDKSKKVQVKRFLDES